MVRCVVEFKAKQPSKKNARGNCYCQRALFIVVIVCLAVSFFVAVKLPKNAPSNKRPAGRILATLGTILKAELLTVWLNRRFGPVRFGCGSGNIKPPVRRFERFARFYEIAIKKVYIVTEKMKKYEREQAILHY